MLVDARAPRRAGCGGRAGRPSAARSCPRCRSASGRRRARRRASAARSRSPGRRPRRRQRSCPRASPSTTITCSSSAGPAPRAAPSRNCRLDDHDRRARVGDHVRDLLGRGGHVDRERRRAERDRRQVGEVELGPVAEHQRDACRRAARRARPGRRRARRRARAARPGQRDLVVLACASRPGRACVGGGEAERLGDRRRADRARRVAGSVLPSMAATLPRRSKPPSWSRRCRCDSRRRTG